MPFEGGPGEAVTMHLDLVNSGTTALYYSWEQIPNPNPLGTYLHEGVQRFYFDTEGGGLNTFCPFNSITGVYAT